MYKLSIALLFLISCTACSMKSQVEPPEVWVTNLLLQEVTLFETTAVVDLRIENENPFPLKIGGSSHRLYLNGQYIGKALDNSGFSVPALSTARKSVNLQLSNISMLRNLTSMVNSEGIEYRLESTLHGKEFWGGTINTSKSGKIDISNKGARL